jgi:hypothetical protein
MAEAPQPTLPAAAPPPQDPVAAPHSAHPTFPKLKFIEELKRRNVGRVAILYVIACYLRSMADDPRFKAFLRKLNLP